jgi:hypothetical protein
MKTTIHNSSRFRMPFIRVMVLGALGLVLVGTSGCMRVGHDVQALRDGVLGSLSNSADQQFELGLGPLTLGAARWGLQKVDLDQDVRLVLNSVRGVEVGIYRYPKTKLTRSNQSLLANADAAMRPRGWERLVTVMRGGDSVLVYVPSMMRSSKDVRLCILTQKEGDLVLISARSNLEPLLALASRHANRMPPEQSAM